MDCDISSALTLTLLFYVRNKAILFLMLATPMALSFSSIMGAAIPYLGLIILPMLLLYPALLSGMTYIIARESFLGDQENAGASEKATAGMRRWAMGKA